MEVKVSSQSAKKEKEGVKIFYESFGWQKTPAGHYRNTNAFIDTRQVMQNYYMRGHKREIRVFANGGKYFLDAGCGANPYIHYSTAFDFHVCVDFTRTALLEARQQLGDRGLFVMADICSLPFKDRVFDGIVCPHVLYHMAEKEQLKALKDLYRILSTNSSCLIFYSNGSDALVRKWL